MPFVERVFAPGNSTGPHPYCLRSFARLSGSVDAGGVASFAALIVVSFRLCNVIPKADHRFVKRFVLDAELANTPGPQTKHLPTIGGQRKQRAAII